MSQKDAERRLGIRLSKLVGDTVNTSELLSCTAPMNLKELIFDRLADRVESEGFPEATIEPFKEAVVHDIIYGMLELQCEYLYPHVSS